MRVVHVDTGRERRGGQVQLLHLLRARPDDVVVMPPDAAWRADVERLGNPVRFVPFRGAWRGAGALARIVADERPDLVAAHTSHAHTHAWRAGGAPLVVHRRSDFAPGLLSGPKYRAPAGYVAVSAAVREVLVGAGVPRDRVAVVYDGVDTARFHSSRAAGGGGVPRIGAVGALVDHKGHDTLIEAAARLRSRGRPIAVVVAGEGTRRGALHRLARERGVAVELLGAIDDVPAFLATLDLFVHPSREEGLGQAVIEAMLAGVPVIAAAAGGLPEIVVPDTGLLVDPGDPEALADAIIRALADPVGSTARAIAARAHAEGFSISAMVEATEAAWTRFFGGTTETRRATEGARRVFPG